MNKYIGIGITSFLLIFMYCQNAFAFFLSPSITHCAYQDGGQYYGPVENTICRTSFTQGDGIAYQFTLDQPYVVTSLEALMSQRDDDPSAIESARHNLVLYSDTEVNEQRGTVPKLNSLFASSEFEVVENKKQSLSGDPILQWDGAYKLAYAFHPGVYWIGFEGGGTGTFIEPQLRFKVRPYSNNQIVTIHNPEPSTWSLFAMGLAFILLSVIRRAARNEI
jgi:hypothetical protein